MDKVDKLKNLLLEMKNNNSESEFEMMTEIIRRKIESGTLNEYYEIYDSFDIILESILDPVQKERFSLIFDKKDVIRDDVKEWILKKISEWKNGLDIEFDMEGLRLYGSSTGFQYTDTSDIDLHISTTLTSRQIRDIGKLVKLGNLFDNDKNPVTLFILDKDEKEDLKKYENLYDLDTDTWIKKSDKNDYEVPYGYILELSEFFMNAFDLSLSQYERAKHEYQTYLDLDPDKQEITKEEKKRAVDKALLDLKSSHDRLRLGMQVMRSFAREGYEEGRDFQIHIIYNSSKDPRLSVNNAVYKMLERFKYTERLKSAINEAKKIIPGDNDSMVNRGK